jgi:hypothetical protein
MGRSKERAVQDKGAQGEMAAAANVEWDGLTAARRCEACDGRVCRKMFLRETEETYRGGDIQCSVHAGLGSSV